MGNRALERACMSDHNSEANTFNNTPAPSALNIPTRMASRMHRAVPVIGWGAFKIGRNQGAKYPNAFDIPSETDAIALVRELIKDGVRLIDTAPAYGLSEERLGKVFSSLPTDLRSELFISTKVGETCVDGVSSFDFSRAAATASVERSLAKLNCAFVDSVFVHSNGSDQDIIQESGCIEALDELKNKSIIGSIGFSSKTILGGEIALKHPLIDAVMLEIHPDATDMLTLLPLAHELGKAVFVKKPLASGTLDPKIALPWLLAHKHITSVVVGGLNQKRLRENFRMACQVS